MATVVIRNAELTEQAYLDMERASPIKHEYVAGRLYAMTGSSDAHNIIALNLAMILRTHLRGSPCRVFIAEVKLRARQADAYYCPDVMVFCEKAVDCHYREQPVLVVEVLSDSTAAYDAGEKRRAYQSVKVSGNMY